MADKTLSELLSSQAFTPTHAMQTRKSLSLHEKGKRYVMKMQPEMECCAYQVDGHIISDTKTDKCDYVILASNGHLWAETFVELKGCDIAHAIKQIKATLAYPLFKQTKHKIRRARVVTDNRIPANTGNSIVERARDDLRKMGCSFRVIKSMQPDILRKEDF